MLPNSHPATNVKVIIPPSGISTLLEALTLIETELLLLPLVSTSVGVIDLLVQSAVLAITVVQSNSAVNVSAAHTVFTGPSYIDLAASAVLTEYVAPRVVKFVI